MAEAPASATTGKKRSLRDLPPLVWLLGLASFFNDASSEGIYPLLPGFLASLGAPAVFLGFMEGLADFVAAILKIAAGRLSDRVNRAPLVAGGYALPALARAGIALALAPWHVLTARLVDRVGKGIRTGPRDALLGDAVPSEERGRAFGLQNSLDHLGAAVGPLVATILLALGASIRTVFMVAAGLGLLAPLLLALRLRDPRVTPGQATAAPAPRAAIRSAFWPYLAACTLFALGNSSDAFLLARASGTGFAPAALPLIWLFHHLVKSALGVPLGGLADRFPKAPLVAVGWLAYGFVYVGFAFASSQWEIAALFGAYALYHGFAESTQRAIVADLAGAGAKGRAFGYYHGALGFCSLATGLATGFIWDRSGPATAMLANAACAGAAAVFLALLAFLGPLRPRPAA